MSVRTVDFESTASAISPLGPIKEFAVNSLQEKVLLLSTAYCLFLPLPRAIMQLFVRQNPVRRLCELKDLRRQRLFLRVSVRVEPVDHVRQAAHWADLDDLLETEHSRGNSGVNAVGEPVASLLPRFDDRSRVDARPGAERITPEHGVAVGERDEIGRAHV